MADFLFFKTIFMAKKRPKQIILEGQGFDLKILNISICETGINKNRFLSLTHVMTWLLCEFQQKDPPTTSPILKNRL